MGWTLFSLSLIFFNRTALEIKKRKRGVRERNLGKMLIFPDSQKCAGSKKNRKKGMIERCKFKLI